MPPDSQSPHADSRQDSGEAIPDFDVQRGLAEFADLNRRRLFGAPPLEVLEVERWLELRGCLEAHFGTRDEGDWTGLERRSFLRLPTRIPVDVTAGGESVQLNVRDISQGGFFIATREPLERGTPVSLRLSYSEDEAPIELSGTVAWVRSARRGRDAAGMGVEFGGLDDAKRAIIAKLVQGAASSE